MTGTIGSPDAYGMSNAPHASVAAIDHVGIAVPDLDAAIAFYVGTFGWRVAHAEANAEAGVREAMLRAPDDTGAGAAIQLLAPLRPDSVIARFLDRHGPGLQQLAGRVTDIATVSAALRGNGLRLLYRQPKPGTAGSLVNFVNPGDAGGVLIELVQPARPGERQS
jgi:methylmalonyl-CoA/ethylmalonyl-CoA epimerase